MTKPTDITKALARLSGLSSEQVAVIWAHVRENRCKEQSCIGHRFDAPTGAIRIGAKFTCTVCGCELSLPDIAQYRYGYMAAGGDGDDVWPGFDGVMAR
jgi:hypothetical protein